MTSYNHNSYDTALRDKQLYPAIEPVQATQSLGNSSCLKPSPLSNSDVDFQTARNSTVAADKRTNSYDSFKPEQQLMESQNSVNEEMMLDQSIEASTSSILFSWQDIYFSVPKMITHGQKKNEKDFLLEIDDPRAGLIKAHNEGGNINKS